MASDAPAASLLATASALHRQLESHFDDPSQPHPLALHSTDPLATLAHLRESVTRSIHQLKHGLAHFPLTTQAVEEQQPSSSQARDRYLTQLKDAASSEAALIALRNPPRKRTRSSYLDLEAEEERERDHRWRVKTPRRGGGPTTLQLLEQIAQELQLATFRDHEEEEDAGPEARDGGDVRMSTGAAVPVPVTLSIGGQLVVVDLTFPSSSSSLSQIAHIKVAYVLKGQDKQSPFAANRLERLFSLAGGEEATEQKRWKAVGRILGELKRLDEVAERTGRDAFAELEELNAELENSLAARGRGGTSDPAPAASSAIQLISSIDSLYPTLIYFATPFARLSSTYQRLFPSSSFSPASAPDVLTRAELLELISSRSSDTSSSTGAGAGAGAGGGAAEGHTGIYSLQLELGPLPPVPPPLSTSSPSSSSSAASSKPKPASLLLGRVVPPLPIHAATGRAVLDALALADPEAAGAGRGGGGDQTGARRTEFGSTTGEEGDKGLGSPSFSVKKRGEEEGEKWIWSVLEREIESGRSATRGWYEQILPIRDERPLLLRFNFDSPSSSFGSTSSSRSIPSTSSSTSSSSNAAFLASCLPFPSSVPQLLKALALLGRQAQLNELLRSAVQERFGVTRQRNNEEDDKIMGRKGENLRVGEGKMTLEELFAPPAPDAPLIVPVSISAPSTSRSSHTQESEGDDAATLLLSFPFPALENAPTELLALPLSLRFSLAPSPSPSHPDAAGVQVSLQAPERVLRLLPGGGAGGGGLRALEERCRRIVDETGVLGLVVAEVIKALRRGCAA
ncbi:hypothetical protein JCM10908_005047 [Rhodotorula pacifica]|uniref:uncharacterized protein n=1 Tax=Rhodotorula pacifica TaxID=1495444 RepID=UPI0031800EE5